MTAFSTRAAAISSKKVGKSPKRKEAESNGTVNFRLPLLRKFSSVSEAEIC